MSDLEVYRVAERGRLSLPQARVLIRCVAAAGGIIPVDGINPSCRDALVRHGLVTTDGWMVQITDAGRIRIGRSDTVKQPTLDPGTIVRFANPCSCTMMVDQSIDDGRMFRVWFTSICRRHAERSVIGAFATFTQADLLVHHDQWHMQPAPTEHETTVVGWCSAPWSVCVRRARTTITYGPATSRRTVTTCVWCAQVAHQMWAIGRYVGRRVPHAGHLAYRIGEPVQLRILSMPQASTALVVPIHGHDLERTLVAVEDLVVIGPLETETPS